MKDKTTEYVGESGRRLTFFQIAMFVWKEGAEIHQTENGFVVNGELFTAEDGDVDAVQE